MATYVGFTSAGIPGSAIATLGLITPSIIVIIIVATVLRRFRDSKYVGAAFYGLRPASTGLIAAAGWSVISISLLDLPGWQADGQLLTLLNWRCLLVGGGSPGAHPDQAHQKIASRPLVLSPPGGVLFQLLSTAVTKTTKRSFLYRS